MTISTIRRAIADDHAAIERAAEQFCARHNITRAHDEQLFAVAIEQEIDSSRDSDRGYTNAMPRIARLWQQCYCRALGMPYDSKLTIGFGHVGRLVD